MNVVAMLCEEDKRRKWDDYLSCASSTYRSTPQESTGETPNMMMLGREVQLPVDLTTITVPPEDEILGDYAENLRSRFQKAYHKAEKCLKKNAVKQKKHYDRHTQQPTFKEGTFVWMYDFTRKTGVSPKLKLRWTGPYLIVTKLSDVTFHIQASERSKPKVVHCDRLDST